MFRYDRNDAGPASKVEDGPIRWSIRSNRWPGLVSVMTEKEVSEPERPFGLLGQHRREIERCE